MIEFHALSVRYGSRPVLRGIDLVIPAGQRVAVVGANGAGKSTLIRSLLALAPFTGAACVGGHDVLRDGLHARALVGYVPQTPSFPAALTAAEVVAYFQEIRGLPADPLPLLHVAGLDEAAGQPVRAFSGGMVRRLALATSRIGAPPVLLLDEPTSQLDAAGERLVLEWLETAVMDGRTVLLATHHLDGLAAVVDRVVLLDDGRIAADQEMATLRAGRWLEVVTVTPVPPDLAALCRAPLFQPGAAQIMPDRNGRVHLRVPGVALAEVVHVLRGRPLQIHEPSLEELLRSGQRSSEQRSEDQA